MIQVPKMVQESQLWSENFREIIPFDDRPVERAAWKEGLVAGNGRQGVIDGCQPGNTTWIFQNIEFLMPTDQPRVTPEGVGEQLAAARQAVLVMDDTWDVDGRKRTYLYPFHPGALLRGKEPEKKNGQIAGYRRWIRGGTGELLTEYLENTVKRSRRTFVSREDDCVVTEYCSNYEYSFSWNVDFTLDFPESFPKYGKRKNGIGPETLMKYEKVVHKDGKALAFFAHYPSFEGSELRKGGYLTLCRVLQLGGTREVLHGKEKQKFSEWTLSSEPCIRIRGAEKIWLLTVSIRELDFGKFDDFPGEQALTALERAAELLEKIVLKYRTEEGGWDYDRALLVHQRRHQPIYEGAHIRISTDEEETEAEETLMSNEALLEKQKNQDHISGEFLTRAYEVGRHAFSSCAGYSAPRLCGLWTGEWNPAWNGAYTMDANVNIQVSGMNTGNMKEGAFGYFYFLLRQFADWEDNAAKVYGMKGALLAPVNTDGNSAVMVEYDKAYPFQYWNAGASWMAVPVFEFWQCYGNVTIPLPKDLVMLFGKGSLDLEQELLRPMLSKILNFWKQLCTPEYFTDKQGKPKYEAGKKKLEEGEHYLIIPSYSPENYPIGYESSITANAAMDIAAARDCIRMVREVAADTLELLNICRQLERGLPPYQLDETGGLKEWSLPGMKDNHEHRHISHMYCAWPGVETQREKWLLEACKQAIRNRNRNNAGKDDTASHGWIHKALVAARLKDGKAAGDILKLLAHSDIFYSSFMTDHNTDRCRGVYCTDTAIGLVGVLQEMLLYSDSGMIEFLPALPKEWRRGCAVGLMARSRVCVEKFTWDLEAGTVEAEIHSFKKQKLTVICGLTGERQEVCVEEGERITLIFS